MQLQSELVFSPYAWAKLLFMCNNYTHEVCGLGIASKDNPLHIVDIFIPKQICSAYFVEADTADVADNLLMKYCDPDNPNALPATHVGRVWFHTHPAGISGPSGHDEKIFKDSFGKPSWAVMAILPKGGELYARLRSKMQEGVDMNTMMSSRISFQRSCPAINLSEFKKEIDSKVSLRAETLPSVEVREVGAANGSPFRKRVEQPRPAAVVVGNVKEYVPAPFANTTVPSSKAGVVFVPPISPDRIQMLVAEGFTHYLNEKGDDMFSCRDEADVVRQYNYSDAWKLAEARYHLKDEIQQFEEDLYVIACKRAKNEKVYVRDLSGLPREEIANLHHEMLDSQLGMNIIKEEEEMLEAVYSGEMSAEEAFFNLPEIINDKDEIRQCEELLMSSGT